MIKLVMDWQVCNEEDIPLGWIRVSPDGDTLFIPEDPEFSYGLSAKDLRDVADLIDHMAPERVSQKKEGRDGN